MKISGIALTIGILIGLTFPALAQLSVPAFTFTDLEGEAYASTQLDQTQSALIIYFDPWCEHCNTQAEWISQNQADFANVQILFITFEPEQEPIIEFESKHFSGSGWSNVTFLQDLDFQFESYFGYTDDALYIYCFKPDGSKGKYFGKEQPASVLKNNL